MTVCSKGHPFVGKGGHRPEICPQTATQGLAAVKPIDVSDRTRPATLKDAARADEVNIVEAERYGWPNLKGRTKKEWNCLVGLFPSVRPASGAFYNGDKFPEFKGNFFFGCLRGARIIRVVLDGRKVVRQENLLDGKLGRIREIAEGPDGFIYFSTSNRDGRGRPAADDDRIMRLVPEPTASVK